VAVEERGHGDLVRGVKRAWVRAAALPRLTREREQREALEIRRLEDELEPGVRATAVIKSTTVIVER
jgi:hypothetical protein